MWQRASYLRHIGSCFRMGNEWNAQWMKDHHHHHYSYSFVHWYIPGHINYVSFWQPEKVLGIPSIPRILSCTSLLCSANTLLNSWCTKCNLVTCLAPIWPNLPSHLSRQQEPRLLWIFIFSHLNLMPPKTAFSVVKNPEAQGGHTHQVAFPPF